MIKLKRWMKDRGMSKAALARELKVSKALIGYYLKGERFPSVRMAVRVSRLTGIPAAELLAIEKRGVK
jgi:transcriptional regulator with XRE-family HTH domain